LTPIAIAVTLALLYSFTVAREIDTVTMWPMSVTLSTPVGATAIAILMGAGYGVIIGGFGPAEIAGRQSAYGSLESAARSALSVFFASGGLTFLVGVLMIKVLGIEAVHTNLPEFADLDPVVAGPLAWAVVLGLTISLFSGLSLLFVHVVARAAMVASRSAPVRYVGWLEQMVRRRLLFRTAGGYAFIHGLVRDFLSEESGTADG
jgi:hypothetical protein